MHVKFVLTGVSVLNKQGTIHMAESIETDAYIGEAADNSYAAYLS
jgi:hypothetical protein